MTKELQKTQRTTISCHDERGSYDRELANAILDRLVLARSAFSHPMNFRSVVAFGEARVITDEREKDKAFRSLRPQGRRFRSTTDYRLPATGAG